MKFNIAHYLKCKQSAGNVRNKCQVEALELDKNLRWSQDTHNKHQVQFQIHKPEFLRNILFQSKNLLCVYWLLFATLKEGIEERKYHHLFGIRYHKIVLICIIISPLQTTILKILHAF